MEPTSPLSPEPLQPPLPSSVSSEPARHRLGAVEIALLAATAVGTAVRLWFVLKAHRPIEFDYSDMHGYIDRAREMADPYRRSIPAEWYYPSGTSALLAAQLRLFGQKGWTVAAALQGLLSGLEIPLVYLGARRFFGKGVALAAALLFATDYLSIGYAGFFLSENYLTIGLVAATALFVPERPGRCLASGLMLGLGAWAKSQAFLLAPLWGLLLIGRRRWTSAALLLAGALAVVIPVSVVCSIKSGARTFISNNGGQTFALGQCPIQEISYSDPVSKTGAMFTLPVLQQRKDRGEVEATWANAAYSEPFYHSGFYLKEGLRCIRRWPRHALRMLVLHLADTFAGPPWSNIIPWPDSHTAFRPWSLGTNLVIAYLFAPLAFFGLWLRRREDGIWYVFALPVLSLLATAVLFHGDPRFREPYDFAFFVAACAGISAWWSRRGTKTEGAGSPPAPSPPPTR